MTNTTKFNLKGGRHVYVDVPQEIFMKFDDAQAKHKFLTIEGHKFDYVGEENGMRIFSEADIVEVKVANKLRLKSAQALSEQERSNQSIIEEQIKNIGINRNSPLIAQIREIKQRSHVFPRDKAKIQVLWWEAKRQAFKQQMDKANVETPLTELQSERSLTKQILEELSNRITQAVKEYKKFPDVKSSLKLAALSGDQKQSLYDEFNKQFGSTTAPGHGELKSWLESRYIRDMFPGETYDSLRGLIYKYRVENDYPISIQEVSKADYPIPTAEDYKRRDEAIQRDRDKTRAYWEDKSNKEILQRALKHSILRTLNKDKKRLQQALRAYPISKIMEQVHYNRREICLEIIVALQQREIKPPAPEQLGEAFSSAAKEVKVILSNQKQDLQKRR